MAELGLETKEDKIQPPPLFQIEDQAGIVEWASTEEAE